MDYELITIANKALERSKRLYFFLSLLPLLYFLTFAYSRRRATRSNRRKLVKITRFELSFCPDSYTWRSYTRILQRSQLNRSAQILRACICALFLIGNSTDWCRVLYTIYLRKSVHLQDISPLPKESVTSKCHQWFRSCRGRPLSQQLDFSSQACE